MTITALLLAAAGILCILYGIMVFLIRSGTMFFAVWLALGGFLLLLGALTQAGFWAAIPKIARSLLLGVITLGLLALLVCEAFVLRGFGAAAPAGLDYLSENPSTLCIVTGGRGATEPVSEGEGMRDYLLSQGIAGSRILVEDKALNTVQNINLSKRLMSSPDAPAALVTNNFHVSRALALARKQGLTDVYAIAAPSDPLFLPNNMFREFFGFTKDFLQGNL